MPCFVTKEAFPSEAAPLAATIQPFEQEFMHLLLKASDPTAVIAHSKVVEVTPHFLCHFPPNLR